MKSWVRPKYWAYVQEIKRHRCEDTRYAAAEVVTKDAYLSFQAEEVGQHSLKLGLKGESLRPLEPVASPATLPRPSAIRQSSPSLALLYH